MFNRSLPAANESFEARRTITSRLREQLREIPASPLDWSAFDPRMPVDSFAGLEQLLCSAPARTAELRALWRESVITAAFASRIAPQMGADAVTSAIAGLLHRLGDMLTLRGIAVIEHDSHLRLDSASKSDLFAVHGVETLERVLRAWGVPPRAAATAAQWRRLREFPGAAADAAAVYLARLFAVELISPQFCAPGLVDAAVEEAGLDAGRLSAVRADATIAAILTSLR